MELPFSTIVAPLLEALRPVVTIDSGGDGGRSAERVAAFVAAWNGEIRVPTGSVHRIVPGSTVQGMLAQSGGFDRLSESPDAELVLLHSDANWWTVNGQLSALAAGLRDPTAGLPVIVVGGADEPTSRRDRYTDPQRVPAEARQPYEMVGSYWQALDHSTPRNGVMTAVEDFLAAHEGFRALVVPGFGGVVILYPTARISDGSAALATLLRELELAPAARAHADALARRIGEQSYVIDAASERIAELEADREQSEPLRDEALELRQRMRGLADRLSVERAYAIDAELRAASAQRELRSASSAGPGPSSGAAPSPELSADDVRAMLHPAALLRALGWPGPESELSRPIPSDLRGVITRRAEQRVVVHAGDDLPALRETVCSIADRAGTEVGLTIALPGDAPDEMRGLVGRIRRLVPGAELRTGEGSDGDLTLAAGEMLPWGWPLRSSTDAIAVAYLLPDVDREGSGGTHSIVEEARALRALGAQSRICIPQDVLGRAADLYGNGDRLFVTYSGNGAVVEAIGDAGVVVATDNRSSPLVARATAARPELISAYYVQDYEALFSAAGSQDSDRTLLSYGGRSDQHLCATSHWLRNLLAARHNIAVAKVPAGLSEVFTAGSRPPPPDDRLRVVATIRPHAERRRPLATLQALALVERALGDQVRTSAFGCPRAASRALAEQADSRADHLGLLSREEVAGLLLSSDVFLDGSAYQALGRAGLEAMGCGAVPVLPELGGTAEYAADGVNARLVATGAPEDLATAIVLLAGDRDRLARMSRVGRETASRFGVRAAASAQLELFASLIEAGHYSPASTIVVSDAGARPS